MIYFRYNRPHSNLFTALLLLTAYGVVFLPLSFVDPGHLNFFENPMHSALFVLVGGLLGMVALLLWVLKYSLRLMDCEGSLTLCGDKATLYLGKRTFTLRRNLCSIEDKSFKRGPLLPYVLGDRSYTHLRPPTILFEIRQGKECFQIRESQQERIALFTPENGKTGYLPPSSLMKAIGRLAEEWHCAL